ncbi:hypothetical protein CAPTEDRAFT_195466, partial [Capitella teleta]
MSKQEIEEDLIVKRMEKRKQRAAKKVEAKRQDSIFHVPGIHNLHSVRPAGPNQISVAETSSGPFIDAQIREANMDVNYEQSPPEDLLTLANGQWVLVNYDGANYPGEVVEISEKQQEVKVNTMESV